ncbi:MAG: helix-turn-helix domain-containing protein [Henriciella sp.]|jgi:transcriptional regulator GlxA family with amidase domain
MFKIVILAFDGCMAGAISAPADLFATANHIKAAQDSGFASNPLFSIITASPDGRPVSCGSGHTFSPDMAISDVGHADLVIVPGLLIASEDELLSRIRGLRTISDFLIRMHQQGSKIAAGCSGALILAESGLLNGAEATTTWWLTEAFCRRYPNVTVRSQQMIVESGALVTAAAGTSYLDFSLLLIGKFAGPHIARLCAAYLCIDGPREAQTAYAIPHYRQMRDPFIENADKWIRENMSSSADIPALAKHLGVSARTLVRRFKAATGQPPSSYIQSIRIDRAKYLLQNTRSGITQIAGEVGYQDEDAFRRAFRKLVSHTPTSYRQKSNSF